MGAGRVGQRFSVRAPMPRVGKFTTRINDVSSCGLAIRRR